MQYLNCFGQVDEKTNQLIDECIVEVQQYAHFKVVHQNFSLTHGPIGIQELDLSFCSNDLEFYMKECQTCLVIACTLGIQIDRQIKYYEHIDMARAIVFDAVSSRYLEECCDEYEKTLNLGEHTFRFAPGYGDLPLVLNKTLSRVLNVHKKDWCDIESEWFIYPNEVNAWNHWNRKITTKILYVLCKKRKL